MINGEGIGEDSNSPSKSAIAFADRLDELSSSSPWLGRRSDDSDDSPPSPSSYDSCGESELERYCSANSALGTASLCSSMGTCNEFLGSDFGSMRNLGFGRGSGSRSAAAVSESLDCLSDGGNEFHEENGGFGVETAFSECRSGSESYMGSDVNSPSFIGNLEENSDEIFTRVGVGGESKSLWSPYRNSQSDRGFSEENNDTNEMSLGVGSASSLLHASDKGRNEKFVMAQSSGNGYPLAPSALENYPSHDAIGLANSHVDLPVSSSDGNGTRLFMGADENSLSKGDMCEDKNIENIVGEEASLRFEHSDAEDSSLDYGTDDEDRSYAQSRNLQYLREAKPKNENGLLMSSVVAFGSDDWDDYMQQTEGNDMAPVLLEKPLYQQKDLLETERTHSEKFDSGLSSHFDRSLFHEKKEQNEDVRDIPIACYQVQDVNESAENIKDCLVGNFLVETELPAQNIQGETQYMVEDFDAAKSHLTIKDGANESKLQYICSEEPAGLNEDGILKTGFSSLSDLPLNPLSNIKGSQLQSSATDAFQVKESVFCKEQKLSAPLSLDGNSHHISVMQIAKDSAASVHQEKENLARAEVEKLETDELYDEMVHEMEEILLNSGRPHGARISYSSQRSSSQSVRDGGSTASTSGTDDAYPPVPYPLKIDWIEVVGAKQKRGDVSFGERLVGVKEYTVYIIRVWSGKEQWDVERRYRDFFTLYCQLKTLFTDRGCNLPPPWSSIDRESRKIFGNASPNVISDRSTLIQDCIRSILNESPFSTPSSLVWFLSPRRPLSSASMMNSMTPHSMQKVAVDDKLTSSFSGETLSEDTSALGKTISLLVEIKPRKSVEQLLEEQFHTCAGCHKRLDTGKSLMQELVHTFGWGKPRLCEYTCQLFCASCHTNDTAVLPARVLHFWDFSLYPVSQLAKAYLDSIYDQPMLCVSAVNPFLFSKVPTLLHVMSIRKKIGAMLPYLRCPFRRSIQRGLAARRYLLENNEFFALRDLVDLSKGAFAALPAMIETISGKILEHITQQCLVCCDVGIPCGARQACEDPASFIFPFQEAEITRCSSCDSVFHKSCFGKLVNCPCAAPAEVDERLNPMEQGKHGDTDDKEEMLDITRRNTSTRKPNSKLPVGFFSDLWRPRKNNRVILMGSLPTTAL